MRYPIEPLKGNIEHIYIYINIFFWPYLSHPLEPLRGNSLGPNSLIPNEEPGSSVRYSAALFVSSSVSWKDDAPNPWPESPNPNPQISKPPQEPKTYFSVDS